VSFGHAPRAIVVDASAAVSFLQGDSTRVDRWAEWAKGGAIVLVPAHFGAELANALLRSARLPAAQVALDLDRLSRSGLESVDLRLPALVEAVNLADEHRLTVYDALYLQLALDVEAELATLDTDLIAAARSEGVKLVG
jgi:predicted nucleic acid-binding protein